MDERVRTIFHPRSIAVIGATDTPGKIGQTIMHNILHTQPDCSDRSKGFQGEVYPINPKKETILGLPAYKSVLDVPGEVDLAIVVVPPRFVPDALEEAGKKGVKASVIITAGFGEMGDEGRRFQSEALAHAEKYGMRVVGPNCMGIMSLHEQLNATFAHKFPPSGPISFISQSGAFCSSVIDYADEEYIGFSNFVSIGNKADVDDAAMLEHFAEDPNTKCVALYIESLKDGRAFYETAKKVTREIPVIALKSGRTAKGASAASSHTGALAGSDAAYDAAFKQAGVYRVKTMATLFDAARALGYQPPVTNENIVILTNAGGPGVVAADTASDYGINLAKLSDDTMARLNEFLPPTWSHGNPVDMIGDADEERYRRALETLLLAPEVGGIVLLVVPTAQADTMVVAKDILRLTAEQPEPKKPVIASFVGVVYSPAEDYLEKHGVPEISFPERAVGAMHALVHRKQLIDRLSRQEGEQ